MTDPSEAEFADRVMRAVRAFVESGDLGDLDPVFPEARARADAAFAGTREAFQVLHVATLFVTMGQQRNGIDAFDKVVDLVHAARRLANDDPMVDLAFRSLLCTALTERCARATSAADEDEVLGLTDDVSVQRPGPEPEVAIGMINHRAAVLVGRYSRTRQRADLDAAISLLRQIVTRSGLPTVRAAAVNNLAMALNEVVERDGDPVLLDDAIELTDHSADQLRDAAEHGRRADLFAVRIGLTRITLLARRWASPGPIERSRRRARAGGAPADAHRGLAQRNRRPGAAGLPAQRRGSFQ